jgi:hypothetical protein
MLTHTWQKRRHFTCSSYVWVVFNQGSIPFRHPWGLSIVIPHILAPPAGDLLCSPADSNPQPSDPKS